MSHPPYGSGSRLALCTFEYCQSRSLHIVIVLLLSLLFSTRMAAQSCTVNISTNPSSPVPAGQPVTVNATVTPGLRNSGGDPLSATLNYDGASICSFSDSDGCSTSINPGAAGAHSFNWTCTDGFTGDSNSGSQTLQVTSGSGGGSGGGTIGMLPKFFILTLVYAPPGTQSSAGFTDIASLGVTAMIANTFTAGTMVTFAPDKQNLPFDITGGAVFGFSQAVGLSQSFSDTISSSQGSQVLSAYDFVNHYQDRFFLWLNPELVVTQTGSNSGTFTLTTPPGLNGQPEPMDILDVSVADLLNPSQIPLEKLESRMVDGVSLPGLSNICANLLPPEQCTVTNACGCTASDFATIVKQDPLVFPITGSSGQMVSADSAPSAVDPIRFVRVTQADPFLDGGSGVMNTFTLNDSTTTSTTASEQVTITEGFTLDKQFGFPSTFDLKFQNQNTIAITEAVSLGVSASVSHTATVTLGSPTSGCDEDTDVWEDVLFHTFILVPAGPSPAPCGTQDGDFLFSASPSIQSIPVGGNISFGVYGLGMFGFTGDETLSVAGTPPGATATFVGSPIQGTGAAALQIQTSIATPPQNYPLTVTGTSQGNTHSLNVTLRVTDFTLAASPTAQTVTTNGSTAYTISLTSLTQFDSNITLSVTGLPSGATATFSPCNANPCTITGLSTSSAGSTLTISTSSTTPVGNYTPTVTAQSQGLTHVANINLGVVDFSLTAAQSSQTVIANGSTSYGFSIASLNGFSGNVSFNVTGLPLGTTANFSPSSVNGSGSSTLNVVTSSSTPAGNYQLVVTASSGTDVHSVVVILAVQNFTLSVTPSSQSVVLGGCATYTVTVTAQNGFSGTVLLSLSGQPPITSFNFNPPSISGSGSSTLTLCTSASTPPGIYAFTITATSGNLSHSASATLAAGISFSVTVTPSSVSIPAGGSANSTMIITPRGGFTGLVALSASGLPSGANIVFSPTSVNITGPSSGSSTATVSILSSTAAGTYTLTIVGTSGNLTASSSVAVTVTAPVGDFTLSASPSSQTINAGDSASINVAVSALSGFTGNVSLDVSGLPGDAFVSFSPASINGSGSSLLSISSGTSTGSFFVTITGTSGSLSHSATVTLNINAPPDPCAGGGLGGRGTQPCLQE